MGIKLDIFRFDEATDDVPHRDVVEVDVPETTTVLDALETAKAEIDGSISFRRSCRSAICGSCSMNINGVTGLACKTPCNTVTDADGVIKVDPMPNFQPMKD
ncbi:MAG: 2Fe-2S iron-sulfur cluster binding domain-containing protein, partial [Candidatus Eremiobacteraeota bacterium]|nr:2Fe-2S iron-sulfur cluster binding domain-containing protein [Candidatus Eremiobacteraeota bacterium]